MNESLLDRRDSFLLFDFFFNLGDLEIHDQDPLDNKSSFERDSDHVRSGFHTGGGTHKEVQLDVELDFLPGQCSNPRIEETHVSKAEAVGVNGGHEARRIDKRGGIST